MGPIIGMAYICEKVHFGFYFLFLYFLGNRFFRLDTMGHEGLHHLISKVPWWNTFLGRYFCHFPGFTSHSRYKTIHMMHHRFAGEGRDPDAYLYQEFPIRFKDWLKRIVVDLLTLRIIYEFLEYFTDLPDRIRQWRGQKSTKLVMYKSDFAEYMIFWITVAVLLTVFGGWRLFLLYWLIPAWCHLPIIQLINGFQHGGFDGFAKSRTQSDSFWIIDFIIPLDLCFHHEHHLNSRIPHYNLRAYSEFLKNSSSHDPETHSNLLGSLKILFKDPTNKNS